MSTTLTGSPELTHQALIYDSDEAFVSATTTFCLDGLALGDHVLAVTTETNIGLLRASLGTDAAEVEFVDAQDWYGTPGRTLAAYDHYVDVHKQPHRQVRIIGEPVWHGRDSVEEAEWTRYESVINAAFAHSSAWIVCPYDQRVLPERVVADARRTHPGILTGFGAQVSDAYADPALFTHASDAVSLSPAPDGATLAISFSSDLGWMRRQVADRATALGLAAEPAGRLLMAVNEVATNTLQHGGGQGHIRLWAEEASIICDITDPGQMNAPFPGYLPPGPAARGHGLWVVRQLCDLVEIRTGLPGTQIRLHLRSGLRSRVG
jgi:anti-sigma regulatory factor (Ser/Thr protein kinase)